MLSSVDLIYSAEPNVDLNERMAPSVDLQASARVACIEVARWARWVPKAKPRDLHHCFWGAHAFFGARVHGGSGGGIFFFSLIFWRHLDRRWCIRLNS